MASKDVQMDDGGVGAEDIHPQEDNCNGSDTTVDAKTKRNIKQQRRSGGGGILQNLRRRGSYLNENFDPSDPSTMTDSKLVLKCQVKLTMNSLTRTRILFLYEDVLISAKQKSSTSFHIKNRVDLRDVWLNDDNEDFVATELSSPPKAECLGIGWPIAKAELEFPTVEEKNSWMEKLRALLTIIREKEPPNVIVRLVKNDEKYSVTKSFLVGNCESAKTVLARCTKEFHSESDAGQNGFQLQALMNTNEIPILLTGSEILYRIQTKYNREHSDGCKDFTAENETETAGDGGLLFQMIPLSERKSVTLKRNLINDENSKPAKRASPLARFFRMTFKMADGGRLYRRNLTELYTDGKLCWRLMMMLSHLYLNGPSYEEVFRRPPAIKMQRILQDKIDRGKDLNFDKLNACEMSQLLKSFLNLLPECLLTFELYDDWSEVPKQTSRTAMVSLANSLVSRLPECNLVFLRHLMCVLHRIASHCDVNLMSAKNLSICIGQCLLWLPPPKSPNELDREIKRIGIANSVAEILIENVVDIFGENCLHLFDHLLHQQPLLSAENITENPNNGACSLETENRPTNLRSESTSSAGSGIIRSVSCLNYSTMSLNDETKDEIELLRDVSDEMTVKLNSSWHLSGTAYESMVPFVSLPTGRGLNSSRSSSQMDLFPEKQKKDEKEQEEEEKPSGKVERILEPFLISDQSPAEVELLSFSEVDAPFTTDRLNSVVSKDNSATVDTTASLTAETGNSGNILSEILRMRDNRSSTYELKSVPAEIPKGPSLADTSPNSTHRADSLLPSPPGLIDSVKVLDRDSPTVPMFGFSGTYEALEASAEDRNPSTCNAVEQTVQSTEITLNRSTRPSTASSTAKSVKSHPKTLVIPTVKSTLASGCEIESPIIRKAKHLAFNENCAFGNNRKMKISSPDDGYSSSSNTLSRGSVTGKEFDLLPSRLERSFLSHPDNRSPIQPCPREPLWVNRTESAPAEGSFRNETVTGRSPTSAKTDPSVAPPGIVSRITNQIAQRESSANGPTLNPFSPKPVTPRTMFQSPFSPSFKGTVSLDGVTPPTSDNHDPTVKHSLLQHSNRMTLRPEVPQNLQRSRFVDQDLVSDDSKSLLSRDEKQQKPRRPIGDTLKLNIPTEARSTTGRPIQEIRKSNADTLKETTKPPIRQTISSPKTPDSVSNLRSKVETDEVFHRKELTIIDDNDLQNKSAVPRLRYSDPKITIPICTRGQTVGLVERSNSDACEAVTLTSHDEDNENKENLRHQQLKRLSITRQTSTPEKVSKISVESNEIEELDYEIPCSSEVKNMSVKNRDWHRELTEQYSSLASPSVNGGLVSQTRSPAKKPPQRSAQIAPKISFTPKPIWVFQGNASRPTASTPARKT